MLPRGLEPRTSANHTAKELLLGKPHVRDHHNMGA